MEYRFISMAISLGLLAVGCTSALAPENELAGQTVDLDPASGDQSQNKKSTTETSAKPSVGKPPVTTPSGGTSPTGGDGTDPSAGDDGEVLGLVAEEETDLEFEGLSSYALSMKANGMLSVLVLDYEAKDSMFRKVASWECKPCQGADDKRCQAGEAGKSVSLTFMKSFVGAADHKVDQQGFPKEDANTVTGNFLDDQLAGLMISNSINPAATPNSGSVNFVSGKRPADIGDEYEAEVDITFGDGKKYAAKISGTVYELPENPEAPTCSDDEYLDAEYED